MSEIFYLRSEGIVKKVKIRITSVIEYQANPEYYPEEFTPEDILKQEMEVFNDNPFIILEIATVTSQGELING